MRVYRNRRPDRIRRRKISNRGILCSIFLSVLVLGLQLTASGIHGSEHPTTPVEAFSVCGIPDTETVASADHGCCCGSADACCCSPSSANDEAKSNTTSCGCSLTPSKITSGSSDTVFVRTRTLRDRSPFTWNERNAFSVRIASQKVLLRIQDFYLFPTSLPNYIRYQNFRC